MLPKKSAYYSIPCSTFNKRKDKNLRKAGGAPVGLGGAPPVGNPGKPPGGNEGTPPPGKPPVGRGGKPVGTGPVGRGGKPVGKAGGVPPGGPEGVGRGGRPVGGETWRSMTGAARALGMLVEGIFRAGGVEGVGMYLVARKRIVANFIVENRDSICSRS